MSSKKQKAVRAARNLLAQVKDFHEDLPVEEVATVQNFQLYGSIGGRIGGVARADALSADRRSEIAREAAKARWKKHGKKKT